MSDPDDVTLGELGRRVDRLDVQMTEGFRSLRDELRGLAFVPAGVYASDQSATNSRMTRLEEQARTQEQRGWHVRTALALSGFGAVLTIAVGVVLALVGLR